MLPTLVTDSYIGFLNMDHRTDRLQQMTAELERVGLSAERMRGKKPHEYDLTDPKLQVMHRRTAGAIGCHYGQVAIMEKALSLGKHAFVMEDDLVFCSDIQKRLAYMDKWAETHPWDIIWLGGTFHISPPHWHIPNNPDLPGAHIGRDAELTDDPRMIRTFGAFSTHAYLVNKDSLPWVLKRLEEVVHESMGIDWAMIKIQPEILTYAFAPGCCIQRDNMSDIGNGMTVYSGFARLGAHWFADKMEDFQPSTYNWAEADPKNR